ncbi:hypothetical protein DOY81_012719 [Sarcophaga bullata]|nr:hypothetical protein DOY81_012719 [Sarcophaga bullata]
MGLMVFCNEAIMSLHQIWPRNEEPSKESLSPLQEALLKRLGGRAHPFDFNLTSPGTTQCTIGAGKTLLWCSHWNQL